MTPTSIETVSGKFIDLINPTPEQVEIADMAWALSRAPRYVGHSVTAIPYTVGQHSIQCLRYLLDLKAGKKHLVESANAWFEKRLGFMKFDPEWITDDVVLHVLVHDGSEGYLVDIPTPLKHSPQFKAVYEPIEQRMMEAIWQKLELDPPGDIAQCFISWVDAYALSVEAHHLIMSRGRNWTRLIPVTIEGYHEFEQPKTNIAVYTEFLEWIDELQYNRGKRQA